LIASIDSLEISVIFLVIKIRSGLRIKADDRLKEFYPLFLLAFHDRVMNQIISSTFKNFSFASLALIAKKIL